ncbi:hypothetical protein TPB0596_22570 [Tsukamurella pulmonis]|nr:hypothetical protein TPB0596_22570 [Tsukamurella pulmonis]
MLVDPFREIVGAAFVNPHVRQLRSAAGARFAAQVAGARIAVLGVEIAAARTGGAAPGIAGIRRGSAVLSCISAPAGSGAALEIAGARIGRAALGGSRRRSGIDRHFSFLLSAAVFGGHEDRPRLR